MPGFELRGKCCHALGVVDGKRAGKVPCQVLAMLSWMLRALPVLAPSSLPSPIPLGVKIRVSNMGLVL